MEIHLELPRRLECERSRGVDLTGLGAFPAATTEMRSFRTRCVLFPPASDLGRHTLDGGRAKDFVR